MQLDRDGRRRLRRVLREQAPWLVDGEVGPTTVDAGSCGRCDDRPRVVSTCGPASARTLCVDCVLEVGDDGWCDGHRDVAAAARAWANAAPPWWADAVVLWWLATGEVRSPAREHPLGELTSRLPTGLRRALSLPGDDRRQW